MTVRDLIARLIHGYWRRTEGAVVPIVALFTVLLIGISGFAIDIGHVMWVQRQLQTAADAAAMAGAVDVYSAPSNAVALATSYSASSTGKNAFLKSTVTTTANLKCYTSVPYPTCTGGGITYNAIQVTESTDVPMWFSQIVGVKTMTVTATSTASAKGGNSTALDIMIVLDTTASMNTADKKCSGGGPDRIDCAKYGVQQLLSGLDPSKDKVGILVFPGYTQQSGATSQASCSPNGTIAKYAPYSYNSPAAPYYTVAPLDNTFKSSSSSTKLNTSSTVVTAAGAGSCSGKNNGIQAVGGVGTYYAQAILSAEMILANDGNTASQKVIIILSDGDAGTSSSNMTKANGQSLNNADQCQQAVAAAKSAADQGMWVYSIAYGATTSGSCSTDTSNLGTSVWDTYSETVNGKGKSACWTMTNIASDTTKFYSDDANGCVGTGGTDADIVALFKDIAVSLTLPRLIPNNST